MSDPASTGSGIYDTMWGLRNALSAITFFSGIDIMVDEPGVIAAKIDKALMSVGIGVIIGCESLDAHSFFKVDKSAIPAARLVGSVTCLTNISLMVAENVVVNRSDSLAKSGWSVAERLIGEIARQPLSMEERSKVNVLIPVNPLLTVIPDQSLLLLKLQYQTHIKINTGD